MTARPSIPAIAADLFRQRRAAARRMVAAGKWSLPQAEARLAPWAAIAAACGSACRHDGEAGISAGDTKDPLPELRYESRAIYPYDRAGQAETARWHSSEICPRETMLAELAHATRAALDADWRSPASQALLALHLNFADRHPLPPPAPALKEAA